MSSLGPISLGSTSQGHTLHCQASGPAPEWVSLEALLSLSLDGLSRDISQYISSSGGGQRSLGDKEPSIDTPSDLLTPGKVVSDT